MYFCVNEFEVGLTDSIFSGNEQQKVYYLLIIYMKKVVEGQKIRSKLFRQLLRLGANFLWEWIRCSSTNGYFESEKSVWIVDGFDEILSWVNLASE